MKAKEQHEARELRRAGWSINAICRALNVSKSSASLQVRDIELTPEQIEALNQKMLESRQRFSYLSRCGGANRNKAEAEHRQKQFREAGYERARTDEDFRLICALYWGEGTKSRNVFGVSNCDPALLRFVLNWLVRCGFGSRVSFCVQFYGENGLSEDEIRSWWLARLPRLQENHLRKFTRCQINRASQRKKIGRQPYGTARIQVCSTELLCNILGGIRFLEELGDW